MRIRIPQLITQLCTYFQQSKEDEESTDLVETKSSYKLACFIDGRQCFLLQYMHLFNEDCVHLCIGSVQSLTPGQGCEPTRSLASECQSIVTKILSLSKLQTDVSEPSFHLGFVLGTSL